jgi:hypothetical protein
MFTAAPENIDFRHNSNQVGAAFLSKLSHSFTHLAPTSVVFRLSPRLIESFNVLLTIIPFSGFKNQSSQGQPGSENVGNGLVDGKQPPYVFPQLLMESTHIVGTAVVVVTGLGVVTVVIECVVVSSEQEGPVKVGTGLVEGKQPP